MRCVLGEPLPLTPEIHTVSFQLVLQEVNVEWTVPALTHQELNMIFQIQISRLNTSNIIWVENYSTTVKHGEAVRWNWTSDIPLECVTHFIRIRALVDDTKSPPQSSWSNWSSWKEVSAQVSVKPDTVSLFPKDKLLEEGSNITICLMYGQNLYNVSLLEEPKNFSCETQDFKTLNCSWQPGIDTTLSWFQKQSEIYTLCESFSERCEVSKHRNSYTWQITDNSQETYNFTLTAENKLRKRSVNINFNLTHRVHPKAPHDVTLKTIGATKANMTWKVHSRGNNYTLLCQVELQYEGEVKHEHNVSVRMIGNYLFSHLEPDTEYRACVRCTDANHFWKWSDWTKEEFSTPEAEDKVTLGLVFGSAPSQALDVWRQVWTENGRRVVTLFWKVGLAASEGLTLESSALPSSPGETMPLLKSQANGKIIFYNIVVEHETKPIKSEHYSVRAPALGINLSLDLHSYYKIHITANNSVGASPESLLVLSNDSGHEEVQGKTIKGIKDAFNISWEPVSGDAIGYVVDWCAHSQGQHCDLQWKKLGPNTTSTIITSDAFKPGVRYNFRIFERSTEQNDRLVEKQRGYTQELGASPLVNPKVTISNLTPKSFVLSWLHYASDFQSGFIKGYHVYMKSKGMQCNQDWKRILLSDNSVLCKYDVNGSETKTLTVENLRPESLYEIFVTPFTSAGQGPNETFAKVTTPDVRSHLLLQIILPMTLGVLLSIIVCYWKSQWVKEKCYPDIPNPYKSSILSLIKSKKNPHLIMNVKDCIPDVLEVINKAEGSKTQCAGSGKLHTEDVPTKPPSMPTVKDSSGPVPCIFFENFTYDQSAFDSGSHGLIPGPLKDTAHQLGLLAPPNKLQNALENDYMKSLVESPTEETSLIYVSQLASPLCGDKDRLATNAPMPVHGSEYKRQMAGPGSLAPPSLKESNSLTSMILLGQGDQ
ncbi:Oncostatin-M-specific receptor subunit beta [Apodemus speciosus]|uniref:Oncostatin-M-specific receptor subunit beta n=1 Tax=Apodemus speciosus TaxID=105296 RepID=A0ABQ0FJ04_APOSI